MKNKMTDENKRIITDFKKEFALTNEEIIDIYIDYATNGLEPDKALYRLLALKFEGYSSFDLLEMNYTMDEIRKMDESRDELNKEKQDNYNESKKLAKNYIFPNEQ